LEQQFEYRQSAGCAPSVPKNLMRLWHTQEDSNLPSLLSGIIALQVQ
jgi:hypothetical protein